MVLNQKHKRIVKSTEKVLHFRKLCKSYIFYSRVRFLKSAQCKEKGVNLQKNV